MAKEVSAWTRPRLLLLVRSASAERVGWDYRFATAAVMPTSTPGAPAASPRHLPRLAPCSVIYATARSLMTRPANCPHLKR
jgi:hypothetical protein